MDRSQQSNSTRDSLRKIRQETRQTRSLEKLRQYFDELQTLRRQSLDDFDLQVMIGDIHQEIIDRARYLRGEVPAPTPSRDDHSVIFQAGVAPERLLEPPRSPAEKQMELVPVGRDGADEAGPSDAAEIPPEVARIDPKSWRTIMGLALFLCALVLAGFFYLIQTARKLNIEDETRAKTELPVSKPKTEAGATPVISISPTLRLYTDLAPGLVTIDDEAPRSLVDGELMLDNIAVGRHSIEVSGSSGSASFEFDVTGKNAPQVIGSPQASNALAVLVSEKDGRGQLVTSAGPSEILLDGKSAGMTTQAGLELAGLGATDHDLQIVHDRDRQRFVMTYTPAPVLTVYVKSDSNTGILQVVTGEDGVDVYIQDVLFKRKTDHGQVRISIRAGRYPIRVHKDGFTDPPAQFVDIKKADVTRAQFDLLLTGNIASLQIRGAQPGTTTYIDQNFVAAIGPDGGAKISNIKPGDHTIELRHDLETTKRLQRTFKAGEILTLTGADVVLEKNALDATKPAAVLGSPPNGTVDVNKPSNPAPSENPLEGMHVQKGGGFVPYDTPKAAGHYSFRTQGHLGGILKKSKLQWYAAYQDSENYVLFSLDGKHAEVREMRHGKNILWNRVNCSIDSSDWVQVDLAVKPGLVSSRIKAGAEGWLDLGSVASYGRDFTQDRVGVYIPSNDEVAVSNFRFANR